MRDRDQILLETAYDKIKISKEEKKARIAAYDKLAEDFSLRLKEVFGSSLFSKKKIYDNKERFADLDDQYKQLFNTEYSLFSFEDTGERLGNLLSKIGIKRGDLKLEEGPKGMVYWFQE
jgi:hypothetical protein